MTTRKVDCQIISTSGETIFEKKDFEVPEGWSDTAAIIAASKYATNSENSAIDIIDRIANQITDWGIEQGYFSDDLPVKFQNDLKDILVNQRACFNSPVMFNIGVPENSNQASACFILPVEDNMEDILAHNVKSGMIFKSGSGVGINVSKLRAKGELLTNKGTSSGPISFMKMWDACAGSVRSGGKTRRSAVLICMDVNHPDIMEFIECKQHEEKKAKILIANGTDPEEAYQTVFFQNANHSVRVTDEFMRAVEADRDWELKPRKPGPSKTVKAKDILHKIAEIAWETGDPGIQFHDRMNVDNPVPLMGEIRSSNPCGEFCSVDNGACNLASLNLVKYHRDNDGFDWELFKYDIDTMVTAMDILVEAADYPTEEIRKTTLKTRPLGLGFTNLGALLMLTNEPYDSEKARKTASIITRNMTLFAYQRSIELAKQLGSFESFEENVDTITTVAKRLTEDPSHIDDTAYNLAANIESHGLRNSQLTLLAPTGTISFLMDADSTGIEPLFALEATKQLAGGGTMKLIPKCVEEAHSKLIPGGLYPNNPDPRDYQSDICKKITNLPENKQDIFKTANEIHWRDHILMVAACQKHLNGSISKTINMPASATVADVLEAYTLAWREGLKGIAIYRDGCKDMQPLTVTKEEAEDPGEEQWVAFRRRLPATHHSLTHKFSVGGFSGYLTVGLYEDGTPGEVFIRAQKAGSMMSGMLDSFAIAVSFALQYGVPLEALAAKFIGSRFEPAGFTNNEEIRLTTSIMDYIFKWLTARFSEEDDTEEEITDARSSIPPGAPIDASGPPCSECGGMTIRLGGCFYCMTCNQSTGCS